MRLARVFFVELQRARTLIFLMRPVLPKRRKKKSRSSMSLCRQALRDNLGQKHRNRELSGQTFRVLKFIRNVG